MTRTVIFTIITCLCLSFSNGQTINKLVKYGDNKDMLLGEINKSGLQSLPFKAWFNKNYDDYIVNKDLVKTLKKDVKNYTIKAFLGTWCGDSKQEVPRFYNVLETANFPMNQLEVIALDRSDEAYKQSPNGEEKGLNIHKVPTFIFYKDGKEVNRIVEHPKETFERDILKIITTDKYRSNYYITSYLYNVIERSSIDSLKSVEASFIPKMAQYTKGSRELNSFGYVYLRSDQTEKAMYVLDLNAKLFPLDANVFDSLAEAYFVTENYKEALKNYHKVLVLKPDDKNALEMLEKIKLENKL
ncbi:thioredoxin family protein [Lacinutrix jangbogonensis]|uniref:thioredoxin family protein n=1 Tax=Lacinutrix jangbogonensis TaxID=1469557 RepID=UPI00053ED17E|nr:thioredoxin family protein [Lacinutrix jangbogonensis]